MQPCASGCDRLEPGFPRAWLFLFVTRHPARPDVGKRLYEQGKAIRDLEAPSLRDLRIVVCDSASGDTGSGSVRELGSLPPPDKRTNR